jgi:putative toxin-antitoxin system antitoxin component (TIGR02293 family)
MAQTGTRKTSQKFRRVRPNTSTAPIGAGLARFRKFLETGRADPNAHVVLLGLETFESPQLLRSVERGLSYRTFERLVDNTTIPSDDALVLVGIPQRTLTRRKHEGRFHQDESDRLVRASRIFGRALSLFEGDRNAARHGYRSHKKE